MVQDSEMGEGERHCGGREDELWKGWTTQATRVLRARLYIVTRDTDRLSHKIYDEAITALADTKS